jgi:outer membrane protein assembly factor BamE
VISAPISETRIRKQDIMLAKQFTLAAAGLALAISLTGCDTLSNAWDKSVDYIPYVVKPYRADVRQGNLITNDMVTQLEKGMTQAQVQFLLGIPLVRDEFHKDRWDYVYYLLRGNDEKQLRHLTVYFDSEGRLDHWTSDPMPDEQQADQMILGNTTTFEPRAPKKDEGTATDNKDNKADAAAPASEGGEASSSEAAQGAASDESKN